MPLLIVTMPLVILPMSPGVDLNLGTSLIPITNVVLLLRCVLEGSYWQAFNFHPPWQPVTITACMFAIAWAVDQFNRESVLFRESERLDLGLWLVHLVRDRQPTPTAAARRVLRYSDPRGPLLPKLFHADAQRFRRFCPNSTRHTIGGNRLAGVLMTFTVHSQSRETLLLRRPFGRQSPPPLCWPSCCIRSQRNAVGRPTALSSGR